MALIRIAHAASLPSPEDALKAFQASGGAAPRRGPAIVGQWSVGRRRIRARGRRPPHAAGGTSGGQPSMRLAHSAEPTVAAPAIAEPVEEVAVGSLEDMVGLAEKNIANIAMKVQIRTNVRLRPDRARAA